MNTYSYQDCLQRSLQVNWRIEEVLGGSSFNPGQRWLPHTLSAADSLPFLSETQKRKLTHVELGAYSHLFGYVEEFIAPQMNDLAQEQKAGNGKAFEALANMVAEEIKHMTLFQRIRDQVDSQLGFSLQLLDGQKEVTQYVLGKDRGAVLLLIACIEWFTQLHYLSAIQEDDSLDPLTKRIFRAHWLEESQHAKLDHLEALRSFEGMEAAERDQAIEDLIELIQAVDGLLVKQSHFDVENFARYVGSDFTELERNKIFVAELKVKRWVFILSGVTHPNFQELFNTVTTDSQKEKVQLALAS